ncbi:MAG: NAD-dependent deacylase [Rhodocyclaceae bacterium]|nr:NAD-dependent deacylase [Rhodocyclaceae bacterium]
MSIESDLDRVAELCRAARRILFVTGAGISADSGLPTYRGIGGLYDDAHTEDGIPIEVALSGQMMARRPDITWKHLAEIEANCRGAGPNGAHRAIARFEREKDKVLVFTQNVDGLHRAAGSEQVLEIHGTLHRLRCIDCVRSRTVEDYRGLEIPPACPHCGGNLRPDAVLFGEELPEQGLRRLEAALADGFDLVFSIGTTSVFPYVAAPVWWAQRMGWPSVEINPGDSEVSALVDVRLQIGAVDAFAGLGRRLGWSG